MKVLLAAGLIGLTLPVVGVPNSAFADTSFGGYTATASSAIVRVQVFEPALPVPTSPQGDASIGYARSNTSTGPSSQALASYLWPGDIVGDGLGLLLGSDSLKYPVQVKSAYPATDGAPRQNTAQLTDGNGMTTSADGSMTKSTVAAAEIGSNLLSGLGAGLCDLLLSKKCPSSTPVTLPGVLPAVVTLDAARSQSITTTLDGTVTASAHSTVSGLDLLAGLITIDGVDMTSSVVSNGVKATTDGAAKITGLSVAGQKIDLGDPVNLGGTKTPVPHAPIDLAAIGIKIEYLKSSRTVDGAAGAMTVEGLTVTVDASVLSKALHTDLLTGPLTPFLDKIPTAGALLKGLLKLGTKIIITVGNVEAAATATPGYDGSSGPVVPPAAGDSLGGPSDLTSTPGFGGEPIAAGQPAVGQSATLTPEVAPQTFRLPGLTRTPSLLLLGALALVGLAGWLFRAFGAFVLGADNCVLGAAVGVPNLREG